MRIKRLFALITAVMLLLSLPVTALAADTAIDLTKSGSIRITLKDSAEPHDVVKGASFTLYQVGTAFHQDNNLRFQLTEAFAGSNISLNDLRADGLAEHLTAYAEQQNLSGIQSSADENGCVLFDNLQMGLYLAVQEGRVAGYYATVPFLASVPMTSADGRGWIYDIQASPKAEPKPANPSTGTTSLTVEKHWNSGNYTTPNAVTVALLRDGKIYDTRVLNAENQWQYKWVNLDKGYSWSVSELDIPDGYQVSYASISKKVTITNTYVPTISNPDGLTVVKKWDTGNNPHPASVKIELWNDTALYETVILSEENHWTKTWPQLPASTVWHIYEVEIPEQYEVSFSFDGSTVTILNKDTTVEPTPTPSQPSQPDNPNDSSLIQTGQFNWPIPILAIAGILLFVLGWVFYCRGKRNHEK